MKINKLNNYLLHKKTNRKGRTEVLNRTEVFNQHKEILMTIISVVLCYCWFYKHETKTSNTNDDIVHVNTINSLDITLYIPVVLAGPKMRK